VHQRTILGDPKVGRSLSTPNFIRVDKFYFKKEGKFLTMLKKVKFYFSFNFVVVFLFSLS